MEKTYKLEVRKTSTCSAGTRTLALFPLLGEGDCLNVETVIGTEFVNGKVPLYDGSVDKANLYGLIFSCLDAEGATVTKEQVAQMATDYKCVVKLYSAEGNVMKGELVQIIPEGTVSVPKKGKAKGYSAKVTSVMDGKVAEGIVDRENADRILETMYENAVDENLAVRVISGYKIREKAMKIPGTVYVDPYLAASKKRGLEGIISEGLRAAVSRHGIICEGEKSVGKNVYVETIAWLLGMPMYLITFSRNMSPSSVYGEKTTDNSAAEALESFDTTWLKKDKLSRTDAFRNAFTEAELDEIARHVGEFETLKAQAASVHVKIDASELYDWLVTGGVMVFNEVNMAEANFLASFTNQLLDGTGFLFIPGRGEVPISQDCVLFATQNADYQGVEEQNEATMSRFGCLVFKQPDSVKPQLKRAVASALKKDGFEGLDVEEKIFDQSETFYKHCRESAREGVISNASLNIRGFVRAITEVAESGGVAKLARQIEIQVINTCPMDEREELVPILRACMG